MKLIRFDGIHCKERIKSSIFNDENCSHYLLSPLFLDEVTKTLRNSLLKKLRIETTGGPSLPTSNRVVSHDHVICFRCVCSNIIKRWVSRPRRKGWPSPETVQEKYQLPGHVVPVGLKGSPTMGEEWRICTQLHLMKGLNEVQLKVHTLLK